MPLGVSVVAILSLFQMLCDWKPQVFFDLRKRLYDAILSGCIPATWILEGLFARHFHVGDLRLETAREA